MRRSRDQQREPRQHEPDQRLSERPQRVQQGRERRQLHGLRQRLRQPTRGQDRDAERDENDRELRGVVEHEHVRREPSEDRIAELGDALDIEEFAHDEKPRLRLRNVKRSLAEADAPRHACGD